MALSITIKGHNVIGNRRQTIATVDFDSSYPTGGESLTARNLALGIIDMLQVESKSGYIFDYDYTNNKLKVFYPRAAIANTLAIADHAALAHSGTAATTPALAHEAGATAVTSTAATMPDHAAAACTVTQPADHAAMAHTISGVAGVAAGAGEEVPDTTNLSALTSVRVIAMGC
ncbi:MAG: hypothetical protein AB1478_04995 [Nitrospirota bacterium]